MRRAALWLFGIIAVLLIILLVTCPDEDDYYNWLEEEFNITCTVNEMERVCKENNQFLAGNSRELKNTGIYLQVKDHYSSSDREYTINTIGIFNIFINYSSIAIYD